MNSKHVCQVANHFLSEIDRQMVSIHTAHYRTTDPQTKQDLKQQHAVLEEIEQGLKKVLWYHGDVKVQKVSTNKARKQLDHFKRELALMFMYRKDNVDSKELERLDRVWKFVCSADQPPATPPEGFVELDELVEGSSPAGEIEDVMYATAPATGTVTRI